MLTQDIRHNEGVENKRFNLRLAASKINAVTIHPGQILSFWRIIGNPDKHYKSSRAIINGKIVEDKGGGLCQISGALYHISLIAGLEIIERHNHSLDIYTDQTRFTPLGTDATLVYGYKDLRICNNTQTAIRFEVLIEGNKLTACLKSAEAIAGSALTYRVNNEAGIKVVHTIGADGKILAISRYRTL